MSDIVERLARAIKSQVATIELMETALHEIEYLRALAGSMGHQVECPPVPKSVDPAGW